MTSHQPSQFSPLVSIVIPVYNGANYLKESIDSALNQSYPHIEVIVVNDGSRDEGATEAVALSYGDRIRYFSKANGGCGSALNFGIEQMKGEYFSWLSHDDRYTSNKIEWQIDKLSSLKDRYAILYGGYELIDSKSDIVGSVRPDQQYSEGQLNTPLFAVLEGLAYGCTFLIPKKSFFEIGFFDESLPTTQDYALWFEFFRALPIHYDFGINTQYRLHLEQATQHHPGHINECDELWIGFINKTTSREKCALYGSDFGFHEQLATFLKGTPYKQATLYAENIRNNLLNQITVSIIIPFYNKIPLLIESIDSVMQQSHANCEIVLVDDGSTDSLDELNTLMNTTTNIKYFKQDNQGPAQARNHGISNATGKYIAFLDADDLYEKDKIKLQTIFMEKNQLAFSYTNYQKIDIDGKPLETPVAKDNLIEFLYPKLIAECTIATPTVMASRELLESNPFPSQITSGEDVCLWITLSRLVRFGSIGGALTKVRISAESHAYDPIKLATGNLNIAQYLLRDSHHKIHRKEIASLAISIGIKLSPDKLVILTAQELESLHQELKSLSLAQNMPHQKEAITLADVEGYFVSKLKPLMPPFIWAFCARMYRTIRDLIR